MNLMKYRWVFIGIFLLTMVLSVVFLFFNTFNGFGSKPGSSLNLGIDFTGGTKIYFPVPHPVTSSQVAAVLDDLQATQLPKLKYNAPQPGQNPDSTGVMRYKVMVYTNFLSDSEQEIVIKALEAKFGKAEKNQGLEVTRIDPLIGKELVNKSLYAVLIASVLMLVYIWFRFELISGIGAVIALLHDCLLVVGLMALLGMEMNAAIIAALLTILGYSINDTIVVFDRIRENLKYRVKGTSFVELVNDSLLQTFRRSLNTGMSAIVAVLILFVLVPSLKELCFALIVGMTSGTYSSFFIASPIWAIYKDWQERKKLAAKPAVAAK